ncbi:MAG: hypothetical protein JWO30_3462 [Fibrobacteres bacterium]|nr:hypothetical protein [Fibrobacterota bacterium]
MLRIAGSQMGCEVFLAIQLKLRTVRTSLGAYVRLFSVYLHYMLRVLISEAVAPHSIRIPA